MNWPKASLLLIAAVVFVISGCATYKRQGVKIGALDSYESKASVKGITIAADPIDNEAEAKENFYVDVTKVNFYPVLIITQNETSDRIYFMKESVELTDPRGNHYRPLPSEVMADACEHNKLVYALLGGLFSYMSADEANRKMALDWQNKEVPETSITNPGRTRYGFLYFELPEGETPSEYTLSLIAEVLETKEKFPIDIVLPKTAIRTASKVDRAQIPVAFNPQEPWTGKWKVEGSRIVGGTWGMKQSGRTVKSNSDSFYPIEAKVVGNQLEGKVVGDYDTVHKFVLNLSSDGQSFEGTAISGCRNATVILKGRRE